MTSDSTNIEMTASPKDAKKEEVDMNVLEQIFGTANAKPPNTDQPPAIHTIANEKANGHAPVANNNHSRTDDVELLPATQPLLEADRGTNRRPSTGPEVDDLGGNPPANPPPGGIDDGLLEPGDKREGSGEKDGREHKTGDGFSPTPHGEHDDGKWPWHEDQPDFPHDIASRAGFPEGPNTVIPDVNTYQQKKNLAQGMMDLALLSANANQLRYVIESASGHPYFYSSITFITLSIVLQVAVGIGLIMNSRYDVKDEKEICKADKINNMTVLGIFLITIVNVFVTSFSVAPTSTGIATVTGPQQAG